MYFRESNLAVYDDGFGLGKFKFKKVLKKAAKIAVAPVAGAAKLIGVKHATTKILSAPKRVAKAVKKSPLLLLAPPALLLKSKQRKSLGKTLKKVAPYAIPGYAAVKVTKSVFKAAGKAFSRPKGQAEEEQALPPPEEMAPTETAPTPGEEIVEEQADDQFYTEPESSGGGYEMEESPSGGYDYSGGGGTSYEAPPSYTEAEPSYEEPTESEEAAPEEEAATEEEIPSETDTDDESPDPDTEPEGSDLSGLASLASIAVMGSRLGFLPAVTAAAASPMGQKVFKGIGKLFKKKKKSAPAPAPVAVAPAVAKAPAKKPLPKWAIPAAIGGGVLLLLLATSGGEKRSAITVIR